MKLREIAIEVVQVTICLLLFLFGICIAANMQDSICNRRDHICNCKELEPVLVQEESSEPIRKNIQHNQLTLPIPEPKVEAWKIPDNPYILEIEEVAKSYDIVEDLDLLIYAMIQVESNFQPNLTSSAGCIGLMQVSPYHHSDRAIKLGVTDLWDPYSNILVGVDFLEDLYCNYANRDIVLAVMMYNMNFTRAKTMYYNGQWSQYAINVFRIFDELKGG